MQALYWFRQDLRLKDNPALSAALSSAREVALIYILEDLDQQWKLGEAARWWLHHSLKNLSDSLQKYGFELHLIKGSPLKILSEIVAHNEINDVYWNRRYEPESIETDKAVKNKIVADGIKVHSFPGSVLCEPWKINTKSGGPYKVFTPFWKSLSANITESSTDLIVSRADFSDARHVNVSLKGNDFYELEQLDLLPSVNWDGAFHKTHQVGEKFALGKVDRLLEKLEDYQQKRDFPAEDATSNLSPHLRFGEISPRYLWYKLESIPTSSPFLRQLAWRDFAYHLLFHFPHTTTKPLRENFNKFPWADNQESLTAWTKGQTGYPIVDAGMRQLWATGLMHNRVRMIVASFLVKHLLINWQEGARWFWDTLVDADLANNTLGWQWIAGCGADAAPYFRIFNPVLQSKKFDSQGIYIRKWVPEIANLPDTKIHAPWESSKTVLVEAGIVLGQTYPSPIVDHDWARDRALLSYQQLKDFNV